MNMPIPLPDDLEAQLIELSECGLYVSDDQYTPIQREAMKKLQKLGLVALGWILTPSGLQRLNQRKE